MFPVTLCAKFGFALAFRAAVSKRESVSPCGAICASEAKTSYAIIRYSVPLNLDLRPGLDSRRRMSVGVETGVPPGDFSGVPGTSSGETPVAMAGGEQKLMCFLACAGFDVLAIGFPPAVFVKRLHKRTIFHDCSPGFICEFHNWLSHVDRY